MVCAWTRSAQYPIVCRSQRHGVIAPHPLKAQSATNLGMQSDGFLLVWSYGQINAPAALRLHFLGEGRTGPLGPRVGRDCAA